MLPKLHRLHQERDIVATLRFGRVVHAPLVSVYARKNNTSAIRFGFLVSKKVSGKTHERNLVKRRLRAAAATVVAQVAPGFDLLLVAKKAALPADYPTLYAALIEALRRHRLIAAAARPST